MSAEIFSWPLQPGSPERLLSAPPFDPNNEIHRRAWAAIFLMVREDYLEMTRTELERKVELEIALLDLLDGDVDMELDDEDCCTAFDDDLGNIEACLLGTDWCGAGDCDDAEDDDPAGDPLDEGEAEPWRGVLRPLYGDDQSLGPINEAEAYRDWRRRQCEEPHNPPVTRLPGRR